MKEDVESELSNDYTQSVNLLGPDNVEENESFFVELVFTITTQDPNITTKTIRKSIHILADDTDDFTEATGAELK